MLLLAFGYFLTDSRLLRSIGPFLDAVTALPKKKSVHLKEDGLLGNLAHSINQTSEILEHQEDLLNRQDKARANWIAGVSHDIRTLLSMIVGKGQLNKR